MSPSAFSLYALAFIALSLLFPTTPTDARKELGLFPKRDANILKRDPLANESKIVQKPLRLPSLADVDSLGTSVGGFAQFVGYIKPLTNSPARMFYYFYRSRSGNDSVPLLVHLPGGPGFSTSLAMFYENGPFKFTDTLMSLGWNNYGWDMVADLLFIDQPIGTGFSYSTNEADIPKTSEKAAAHVYEFLQIFIGKNYEGDKTSDVIISADSYASRIAVALANQIRESNMAGKGAFINMKGLLMASPWVNPALQFLAYPDYAEKKSLISRWQWLAMQDLFQNCSQAVQKSCEGTKYDWNACAQANQDCNQVLWDNILTSIEDTNYYDISKTRVSDSTLCYNFSTMETYLNRPSVKKSLGVPKAVDFVAWSGKIYEAMEGDQMRSFEERIPSLLQNGIKILVFTGQYDLICNSLGNLNWMLDTKWSGQKGFNSARFYPLKVNNKVAGTRKSFGIFTYANIKNAGHFVAMDEPKATLELIRRWINDVPL